MKKISIIIPCYNEQEAIPLFYDAAMNAFGQMQCDYEMLFVDDGSKDETLAVLRKLRSKDVHVRYLSLSRNFGKEAAMYAGLCNVSGDYIAILDADMQDPPSLLPEMLRILEDSGVDCVATKRSTRAGEPPVRSWLSRRFYAVVNRMSSVKIAEGARDFRLMKRSMAEAVLKMSERNRFSKGLFEWVGFNTYWISYENVERSAGDTKWSTRGLFSYAIEGITSFSEIPLHIASWVGMLMTLFAFIFLVVIVVRRLCFGDPVAGWASTVSIIVFLGGVQLFFTGVLGQYLAKVYVEVKQRPHFIAAEASDENATMIQ